MNTQSRRDVLMFFDRRIVERLLGGARLPKTARDIRYLRWQPSGDLAYHEALIRFESSKEDYLAFVQARGLTPFVVSGPSVHLPTDCQPPPEIEKPEWWIPSSETPPDAASGKVGVYGSIAVNWGEGRAYALIVDTSHRSSAPSPGA